MQLETKVYQRPQCLDIKLRFFFFLGDISVLRFICHEIKRKKLSIFLCDSSGNTALHLATKQKTRYYNCKVDVIKMLLGAGINPLLKNNDKKIAFELLLEDEKRSIQLLQKYNPPGNKIYSIFKII